MPRPRSWSDDDLRAAVPVATSWSDLRRRLGLVGGGTTNDLLRRRCEELGLGTSYWDRGAVCPGESRRKDPTPIDDGELQRVLPEARSLAEVLDALGMDPGNGSDYRRLHRRIGELELPVDHLMGQGWARGRAPARTRRPLEEILVVDSPWRSGSASLRRRLVSEGVFEWGCAGCGLETWNGAPAPLQLDHVNGDPRDNRRENLRLLCPNCHAQTPTYCGRNMGNGYSSRSSGG